jgi:hypothetical protein
MRSRRMRGAQHVCPIVSLAFFVSLLATNRSQAQVENGNQLPQARLLAVTPIGGKAGTTVEMTFSGQDLDAPTALLFSHPNIKATPVIPPAPPPAKPDPKKPQPPEPAPPQVSKFQVSIGDDVPLGAYDVRLVGKWGVSNPRIFEVSDQVEVLEKEPNNDVEQAQRVPLGCIVNGTISAQNDVDYFIFAGKKGQRVVVRCITANVGSRLKPEVVLATTSLRELARQHGSAGHDVVVDAELPVDGDYLVRVCQFGYTQGNAECFYRLHISAAPWIDAIHPTAIEPGKTAQITAWGRNLPGGKIDPSAILHGRALEKISVTVTAPSDPQALDRLNYSGVVPPLLSHLDGFEFRVRNEAGASNAMLVGFARAPVVLDNEANDTPETAQEIPVPCEVCGRIEKLGDRDWYTFTAKKGDVYMIDLLGERIGSASDFYLVLRNAASKQDIVQLDDNNETLHPFRFLTLTRDPPPYRFVVPADGKYQILVGSHSAEVVADVQQVYRLRIAPERPDYRLIVVPPDQTRPDAMTLWQGGNVYSSVFVWRLDGFKGEIALEVEGLPEGVTCKPQVVGPNIKHSLLVLSAEADTPEQVAALTIKGTATINGNKVEHVARTASVAFPVQQNVPTVTKLDRTLYMAIRGKAPYNLSVANEKIAISQGDKLTVPFKVTRHWPEIKANILITPSPNAFPPGFNFGPVNIPANKNEATLVMNIPSNMQPGTYTIVFRSFAPIPYNRDPKNKQRPNVNVVQTATPLLLTVLPKQLANITVPNPNPTVKAGAQAEVVVRVNRLHDYAGEFKVTLVPPPDTQPGLAFDEGVIPTGQSETKLVIRAAADAAPGNRQNITLRLVGTYNGNVEINHETKINVNVVK